MVTSVFNFIMYLSRIAGIAPYSLNSVQHRLVKILVNLYSFILVTGISVSLVITFLLRILNNTVPLRTFSIMHYSCEIFAFIIMVIGGCSSLRRMKQMTRVIEQLEQIEKKLSYSQTIPDDKNTSCHFLNIIFLLYIVICAVLRLINCVCLYKSEDSILIAVHYWIKQYIIVVLEMQLAAFAGRILRTLQIINTSLQNLLPHQWFPNEDIIHVSRQKRRLGWEESTNHDIKNDVYNLNNTNINNVQNQLVIGTVQINENEEIEYKIRDLVTSYMKIVDLVEDWITADGLLITIILINHMVQFEWLSFAAIQNMIVSKCMLGFVAIINACLIATHVLGLMVFIEPFHCTHLQVERIQLLVQLLKVPFSKCIPVTNELELFMRQLVLQRITYSPLNLITLNRHLLVKIFSSLITYLVVSLTYGTNQKSE